MERSAERALQSSQNPWRAYSLIAFTAGLVAVSSNEPRATLMFISAGVVSIGVYFTVSPADDVETKSIAHNFLRTLPDVLIAVCCMLLVLGIGIAFPNESAVIPLFVFVSLAALATRFGATFGVWHTATLYGLGLGSLVAFVALAFMA